MHPPPIKAVQVPSMGIKLIVIGALAVAMMIPAWFVGQLVEDRSQRAGEAAQSIGELLGGFLGPVLAVPYTSGGGA